MTSSTTSAAREASITIKDSPNNPNNNLYIITFQNQPITTTVTADPTVVTTWLATLPPTTSPIGLDIEWRPNFTRQSDNPTATLQLCVNSTCLIFQIIHCHQPLPKPLIDFLSSGSHTFVGVGIETDVEKLLCDYNLMVKNTIDLGDLAAERKAVPRRGCGLKELARVVIGVEVKKPKSVTMSRWDCEWLSYQQIQYACVDAFLSHEIARILLLPSSSFASSST